MVSDLDEGSKRHSQSVKRGIEEIWSPFKFQSSYTSLALSSSKAGLFLFPLISSSEGKILRKPVTTGLMSSLLIEIGTSDNNRTKGARPGSEGNLSSRGSADTNSRSSRRFVVLKWISRRARFWQWVEKETREETVVRHELAGHMRPKLASFKRGNAVAISSISSSVKLKVHSPMLEQDDLSASFASIRNCMIGDMKAVSTGTSGQAVRVVSLEIGPRFDGILLLSPEGIRRVVAAKKGSHWSDTSDSSHRVLSLGKASHGDKSGAFGGPSIGRHAVRLGSCMICRTAASDKIIRTASDSREGPHRRTAEEAADFRLRFACIGGGQLRRNDRRGKVSSSRITDAMLEMTSSRSPAAESGKYESERYVKRGERKRR